MKFNATESFVKVCQKLDEHRFVGAVNWGLLGKNVFGNSKLRASTRLLLFWLCSSSAPMRREAVEAFLKKGCANWHVIEKLLEENKLIELEYEGNKYYIRKLPRRKSSNSFFKKLSSELKALK